MQILAAQLYLPYEDRIPVNKNHTDMIKFASRSDMTYRIVVRHMAMCIGT